MTMDCCLCEKRAKPITLPGGVGGHWWLISITLTIDLSNCVLKFTVKCDTNYVCYLCEQHSLEQHELCAQLSQKRKDSCRQ